LKAYPPKSRVSPLGEAKSATWHCTTYRYFFAFDVRENQSGYPYSNFALIQSSSAARAPPSSSRDPESLRDETRPHLYLFSRKDLYREDSDSNPALPGTFQGPARCTASALASASATENFFNQFVRTELDSTSNSNPQLRAASLSNYWGPLMRISIVTTTYVAADV
jgi:hypothetical protein